MASIRTGLVVAVMGLVIGGCATSRTPPLPICDGKHRRDANPYGTVLPGVVTPPPAVAPPAPAAKPNGTGTPLPVPSSTDGAATRSDGHLSAAPRRLPVGSC